MIIQFGFWKIDELGISNMDDSYEIDRLRLWNVNSFEGQNVWSWLIHLTEKKWITLDSIKDFNVAFFFAQDYFKKYKPENVKEVSTAQTLYIQKQLMDIHYKNADEREKKMKEEDYDAFSNFDFEEFQDYLRSITNITLLDLDI